MFILFKTAVLVAVGLVLTQQTVQFLEYRARAASPIAAPAAAAAAATADHLAFQ